MLNLPLPIGTHKNLLSVFFTPISMINEYV